MIQAITESNFTAYLSTEDNRIDTSVASTQIRFLVKFINDMDGSVEYCYPAETIKDRYTKMIFSYLVSPNLYSGQINLLPAGHWKYEIYEVSWIGTVGVAFGTAPATEINVLPVHNDNGVVQGIVTKGILNLTAKSGTEQVQYDQHDSPDTANYVWYGEDITVWNPADEASMVAFYKNKEGITLEGENVSKWADSSANNYDMAQTTTANMPLYTASTGGVICDADDFLTSAAAAFTLATQFTIAFKIKANTYTGKILTDTVTPNTKLDLTGIQGLGLTTTTGLGAALLTATGNWKDAYVVLTRDAANLIQISVNGVLQTSSATIAGSYRFDRIGTDTALQTTLDGSIFELQVYSSTSYTLTANINERLSNL